MDAAAEGLLLADARRLEQQTGELRSEIASLQALLTAIPRGSHRPREALMALAQERERRMAREAAPPTPESESPGLAFAPLVAEAPGAWKAIGAELNVDRDGLRLWASAPYGLAYHAGRRFDDFRLRLRYRLSDPELDARLAVRFRQPEAPEGEAAPGARASTRRRGDPVLLALSTALQVRLGAASPRSPLGTFVSVPFGSQDGFQQRGEPAELRDGWNDLEVEAQGWTFAVTLNGVPTARLPKASVRGQPASAGPGLGFLGLVVRPLAQRSSRRAPHPQRRPGSERPSARRSVLPAGFSAPLMPRARPRPGAATQESERRESGPPSLLVGRMGVEAPADASLTP
jgi:hypothetical protein